ncbi:shape determination protein YodL [Bacillus carboniphilus]|uniref:Shape determination protein YodL n=1 Tax=Bacillus carboniphilus TaxID=86663 RepID=A0ABN0WG15_9BACI
MRTKQAVATGENEFDVTVFQTPCFGEKRGYRQVYRNVLVGEDHFDVMYEVFRTLNVRDLLPKEYNARYMTTGDIVFIDEGKNGHFYYQLKPCGFFPIHRLHVR